MAMKGIKSAAACVLALALAACAHRGGGAGARLEPPQPLNAGGEVFQAGVASWYGEDFSGKATANGEIYDMDKLTAAHPTLPFGTLVEVENAANGKRVLVRINDRGPFLKDRVIDLSFKAAQRLGMADEGTAQVNLRVLRLGNPGNPAAPIGTQAPGSGPAPGAGGCVVQAGAFALRQNAEDLLLILNEIFPGLPFRIVAEDALFKVLSPPLESAACAEVMRQLASHHVPAFMRGPGGADGK
jgi:rare lipoprotein A